PWRNPPDLSGRTIVPVAHEPNSVDILRIRKIDGGKDHGPRHPWGRIDCVSVSLSIGIVGLPNVGKSTLFNALTKNDALAANYPFATIEPNVGVVGVPDARLGKLAEIFGSSKILPATVDFVDIAGIVSGASTGEGLGNKLDRKSKRLNSSNVSNSSA